MKTETINGATRYSKIIGKDAAHVPIESGMIIEVQHAPAFSTNGLTVRHLTPNFEIMF